MFEIRDEEIDVQAIMARIRENLKRRGPAAGLLHDQMTSSALAQGAPLPPVSMADHRLNLIRLLQDPKPQGPIAAHGSLVIARIKRFIRRVLAPYHRAIFARQAEFNANLVGFMTELLQTLQASHSQHLIVIANLRSQLEKLFGDLNERHDDGLGRLEELRQEVTLQKRRLEVILSELREKIGEERAPLAKVACLKERLMDHSYYRFENRHRGSLEEIKKRQEIYLPLFKERFASSSSTTMTLPTVILDVGCGRGEFLELLREHGLPGKGIDVNEDMVYLCRGRGLDVEQDNALHYLQNQPDDSLGGIIAYQVIEHLPVDEMIEFIKLCYQKMEKGGRAVFETVNPLSLVVSATHFYVDFSHIRQVHPQALQFLAEVTGFINTEIKLLSPFPDDSKLQLLAGDDTAFQQINENFKRLNDILFGYQDYALTCEK